MADVARDAGVSPMTVSYVYAQPGRVSAQAAERVHAAAARLHYPGPHPGARSLRRGRAGAIGVVIGEHLTYAFDDPQAARFLSGVAQVCADEGVGMTLVPVTGTAEDSARIAQAAVDGLVVWTTTDDDPILDAVLATGWPAILHGATSRTDIPNLGIDDQGAAEAIGTLTFSGAENPVVLSLPLDRRRRPATIAGPDPGEVGFPVTRERLLGLRRAWEGRGRSWSQVRVVVCARNTAADGAEGAAGLLASGTPVDAIAAMSDELALGALGAIRAAALSVPVDIAVSGWDDTAAAAPSGLSTVHQDLRDQGARCARIALGHPEPHTAPTWQVAERTTTRSQTP